MSDHKPLRPRLEPRSLYSDELVPEKSSFFADQRRLRIFVGAAALATLILIIAIASRLGSSGTEQNANALLGRESLTQEELINLVASNDLTAFWAGPQEGAEYSLTVTTDNQIFIKYLPGGMGLDDSNPNYRIIATYPEPAAYDTTLAAAAQPNSLVFVNGDGAAVYLDKTRANNVYVAYPDTAFSIEVFDPDANTALSIASLPANLKKVE